MYSIANPYLNSISKDRMIKELIKIGGKEWKADGNTYINPSNITKHRIYFNDRDLYEVVYYDVKSNRFVMMQNNSALYVKIIKQLRENLVKEFRTTGVSIREFKNTPISEYRTGEFNDLYGRPHINKNTAVKELDQLMENWNCSYDVDMEIVNKLRDNVDGIVSVKVFTNTNDVIDSDGRPPYSVEFVVEGGFNKDIAYQIWDIKPAGCQTYGNTYYDIIDHFCDESRRIYFSRPTTIKKENYIHPKERSKWTTPLDGFEINDKEREYIVNFKYYHDCSIVNTKSKELSVKAIDEESAVAYAKLHYPNVNVSSIIEKGKNLDFIVLKKSPKYMDGIGLL